MGIAGIWHGPNWTFLIFGLMHGAALAINQAWKKDKKKMPDWLGWVLTLAFVNAAFIVFRSPNMDFAENMLTALLPHGDWTNFWPSFLAMKSAFPITPMLYAKLIAIGVVVGLFFKSSKEMAEAFERTRFTTLATATLVLAGLLPHELRCAEGFRVLRVLSIRSLRRCEKFKSRRRKRLRHQGKSSASNVEPRQ